MPQKAVAAGGTTALAGALVTVLLGLFNHPVGADVQSGLVTIVSAALTFAATYFTPKEQEQSK